MREEGDEQRLAQLRTLAPFVQRSGVAETGRQRLLQHRAKLAFVWVTRDLSENSLKETLKEFPCPVYQALLSQDIAELFGFQGTKIVGFRRGSLSVGVQKCLKETLVPLRPATEMVLPFPLRVAIFGAGSAGLRHARLWREAGAEVVGFLEEDEAGLARGGRRMAEVLNGREIPGDTEPERLLERVKPMVVDVCLPTTLHYPACHLALRLGYHVLCETPFLETEGKSFRTGRRWAQTLLSLAARHQRLLGCALGEESIREFVQGRVTLPVLPSHASPEGDAPEPPVQE